MKMNKGYFLVISTALMSLMFFVSLDIIFPSLPAMANVFQVTNTTIQTIVSSYLLGYAVSQLVYGVLSDCYGRKPILILGTAIYLLGTIICLCSTHFDTLLGGRIVQGLGVGAAGLLSRVILRDCFCGEKLAKNISYVGAAIIVGISIAPAIGGLIQGFIGYRGNFYFMLIFGIFLLLVVIKYLPETNQNKTKPSGLKAIFSTYRVSVKSEGFIAYTSLAAIGTLIILAYSMFNPFFIQESLGFTPVFYGVIALVVATGEFIGATINSRLVEKLGATRMMAIGFSMVALSGVVLIAVNFRGISLWGILLPSVLAAISTGLIIPNAIALAFSQFKENIGASGAVFGFLQVILIAICTSLMTSVFSITTISLSCIFIIAAILGYAIIGLKRVSGVSGGGLPENK